MTFQTFQHKQLADACMPAHPVLQTCSLPDLQVHAASRPHDGPFCSSHVASGFPAHAHLKQLKLCSYGRRHVAMYAQEHPLHRLTARRHR